MINQDLEKKSRISHLSVSPLHISLKNAKICSRAVQIKDVFPKIY